MSSERIELLLTEIFDAKAENIALQCICAALLAEVAMLDKSPADKMTEMVTGITGVASGIARQVGTSGRGPEMTQAITRVMDRVAHLAESILP